MPLDTIAVQLQAMVGELQALHAQYAAEAAEAADLQVVSAFLSKTNSEGAQWTLHVGHADFDRCAAITLSEYTALEVGEAIERGGE